MENRLKLIFYRYFMYSFLAVEVLLLPLFLEKELYATFEYYKFIIFFVPFFMLGSPSGYLYYKYNHKEEYFKDLLFFGFIHFLLIVPFLFIYFDNILFLTLCLMMTISLFVEHKLQTQRRFILALGLKPMISIFLIFSFFLIYFNFVNKITINMLFVLMLLSFLTWLFISFRNISFDKNKKLRIKNYFLLIKKGLPINAGTFLIMLFFFCDRFIAKEYYSEYLASYSFSYNLIQFILLALSTLAYVNVVDVGEKCDNINLYFFKEKIFHSYKIFFILLAFFIFFILIISSFYPFPNLILYSLIMGVLLGNYFTINSLSSIALYLDFFKKIVKMMFYLFLLNLVLSYIFIFFKIDYFYFLIKTGILLNFSALYFIYLSINRLEYNVSK